MGSRPMSRSRVGSDGWSRSRSVPFGGCHLTRAIVDLIEQAGFVVRELDVFYEKGAPKVLGADKLGVAAT